MAKRGEKAQPAAVQSPPKVPLPPNIFPWKLHSGRIVETEEEMRRLWTQLTEEDKVEVTGTSILLQALGSQEVFPLTLCDGRELQTLAEVEQLGKEELLEVFYYALFGMLKTSTDLHNRTAGAMNNFTNVLQGIPEKALLQQLSEGFAGIRAQAAEAKDLLQHLRETTLRNVQQAQRRHCKFTEILKSQQRELEDLKKRIKSLFEGMELQQPFKLLFRVVELFGVVEQIKEIQDQTTSGARVGPGQRCGLISRTVWALLSEQEEAAGRPVAAFFSWFFASVEFGNTCFAAMNNLRVVHQAMAATRNEASRPTEENMVELPSVHDDLQQCRKSTQSFEDFAELVRLTRSCLVRKLGPMNEKGRKIQACFDLLMDGFEAAAVEGEAHQMFAAEAETAHCQKEVRELNSPCKELKEAYEALPLSLRENQNVLTTAVSQLTSLMCEVKTLCHELKEGQKSSTQCLRGSQNDKQTVATLVSMLQAEKEHAQKETSRVSELKARCDYLEARSREYEAFKASLNAHASERVADHVWQGNAGCTPASSSQLSGWNVVASGSAQTICSTSWISIDTIGPCCFLKDAIFTIKTDSGFELCKAIDLRMGSKVLAENGDIIEVKTAPELHEVHKIVELQTESACLQISPDHRIVLPNRSTVQAEKLFIGDLVMVNGHPEPLKQARHMVGRAEVLKLSFFPDLPVTVGHDVGIASKGHKPRRGHPQRRGGRNLKSRPRSWPMTDSE